MTTAHEFMKTAPALGDDDLAAAVRAAMLARPVGTRQLWLRETELALDGYGGERNKLISDRIRQVIRDLSAGLGAG
ncbi:MAG: hypothetical protein AB7E79_16430 [Rhodospirillaceae bacterium]